MLRMKKTRPAPFVVGVMALAIVGCQEAPNGPMASDQEPSFNFTNGPQSPGKSGVFRFEGSFGFLTWEETEGGLLAFHFETADLPPCGGSGLDPDGDFQIVANPAGVTRGIIRVTDTPIYIYDAADALALLFADPPLPFPVVCQFLADDWIYGGTHTFQVLGALGEGPSFGWNGHGDVVDPSGGSFRYSERATYVAVDEAPVEQVFDINVRPRGGN